MQVASKNSLVRRLPTPSAKGLVTVAAVLLVGCGQKGPLRLPPTPASAQAAPSAAAAVPAAASAPAR